MPVISISKTYEDGDTLFEADLDNIIDDIETFLNVTKIDNSNIQDAGIDASVKVEDATITASKIASSAVTTAKVADSAVTTAKINDLAVTTAKINDLAVTTAKINDAAVTYAKRAACNIITSSSSGAFSSSATSYTDVTNLSAAITTTGRPVMLVITSTDGTNSAAFTASASGAGLKILRDATSVAVVALNSAGASPGNLVFIDQPSAGTHTYKAQVIVTSSSITVNYMNLIAIEL